MLYSVNFSTVNADTTLMKIGFGDPAGNDAIVKEVSETAAQAAKDIGGGKTLLVDGPASLPVAFTLCHAFVHLFGNLAVKDPKLGGFVVAVSHGGFAIGTVLGEDGLPKE
jgi:CRISPR-associated protein Csx3